LFSYLAATKIKLHGSKQLTLLSLQCIYRPVSARFESTLYPEIDIILLHCGHVWPAI